MTNFKRISITSISKYFAIWFLSILVFVLVGCNGSKPWTVADEVIIASAEDAAWYFAGTWRITDAVDTEGNVVPRYEEEFVCFRNDRYILDYGFGMSVKEGTLVYGEDGSIILQDDNGVTWSVTIIDMDTFTELTDTGDYAGISYTFTRLSDAGVISQEQ